MKGYLFGIIIITFWGVIDPVQAQNQVKVTASVEENTVGLEETIRYSIEIQGGTFSNVETPRPPETDGLRLVRATPSTQQNISYINGTLQQSLSFVWQYRPTALGKAEIQRTTVTALGKSFQTDPIQITVVPQDQRPSRPNARNRTWPFNDDAEDDATANDQPEVTNDDVFIRALPSARSVYQNQQLVVTYELFFREGVQLRSSRLADSWDAEGFWREDLDVEQRATMRQEVVNGLRYNVVTLKRVSMFPTRTGSLKIEPLSIETEVALPRRHARSSFFFRNMARFQSATISSLPVTIESRPLPGNAPDDFSDAVGTFTINAWTDHDEVQTGEPVTLHINISGRGNIATLDEPTLQLPSLIEQYGVQIKDEINRSRTFVSGSKSFSYTLVPHSEGTHIIPGFQFSFFNPNEREYKSVAIPAMSIKVTGAVSPAASTVAETRFPANDIADLITDASVQRSINPNPLHLSTWTYMLLVFPAVFLIGLYTFRRYTTRIQTDVEYVRTRRAHPLAQKHLKQAEKFLANDQPIPLYDEIARAVLGFIGDRLNIETQGMTRTQLSRILARHRVPEPRLLELQKLLHECDHARYAPVRPSMNIMETATERAATLITDLDAWLK